MKKLLILLGLFIAVKSTAQQIAPGSRTGDTVIHKGFIRTPDMTTASNMTGKKVLVADASGLLYWIIKDSVGGTGGGGGTPGGSDTYIQFNDGGSFGGDAGFTYNKTTNVFSTNNGAYRPTGTISFSDAGAGSVYRSSSDGLVFRAVTGSGYDLMMYDAGGNGIFGVETGTSKLGSTSQIGAGLLGYGSWNAWMNLRGGTTTNASLTIRDGVAPSSPAEGQIWRTTDKVYNVIQTGAATKEFTLNDIALTSGRIPYTTTNGRLTDTATFVRLPGGNVGIGTSSPTGILHVKANAGADEALFVDASSGNVGVGTNAPGVKLDVVGEAQITFSADDLSQRGLQITNTNNDGVSGIGMSVNSNTAYMRLNPDGTLTINSDGGVTIQDLITLPNLSGTGTRTVLADASGVVSAPVSDRSTKQNIQPLQTGIATIMKLNPVSFEYRKEFQNYGKGTQVGFIAQDIQQILPNSTYINNSNGKMGYNEIDLVPLLVKAMQEQQQQIDELKKEIKKLKRK